MSYVTHRKFVVTHVTHRELVVSHAGRRFVAVLNDNDVALAAVIAQAPCILHRLATNKHRLATKKQHVMETNLRLQYVERDIDSHSVLTLIRSTNVV